MLKRKQSNKKRGSLIIEQILVLPIMIGLIWLIMQMVIFVYSNNQVNTAANESAQTLSQIMRGTDKDLNSLDATNKGIVQDEAMKKLLNALGQNTFIMLAKDESQTPEKTYLSIDPNSYLVTGYINYTSSTTTAEERVLLITENKTLCENTMKDNKKRRVICMYTEENGNASELSKKSQQMVIRVKAPFRLIGSVIPGIEDKISLYGNGVSTKEISGRFQYY